MDRVAFYESVPDEWLEFSVILAQSDGKWVFCKHKARDTWEVPGGHREAGETPEQAARRELYEETGALEYTLQPICVYSVEGDTPRLHGYQGKSYGMLYFARISVFEPELHSEIERIWLTDQMPDRWTYPNTQPFLIREARRRGIV